MKIVLFVNIKKNVSFVEEIGNVLGSKILPSICSLCVQLYVVFL